MTFDQLKNKIEQDAQEQAEQIIVHARKQAQEIMQKAKDEVEQHREKVQAQTTKLVETMQRKMLSFARFEASRQEMDARGQLLDQLMAQVEQSLVDLPATKKKALLKSLILKAKDQIDVDCVSVCSKDKAYLPTKVKSKTADIAGGLIACTKDETCSVDLSLDEILNQIRESMVVQISEVLFDGR